MSVLTMNASFFGDSSSLGFLTSLIGLAREFTRNFTLAKYLVDRFWFKAGCPALELGDWYEGSFSTRREQQSRRKAGLWVRTTDRVLVRLEELFVISATGTSQAAALGTEMCRGQTQLLKLLEPRSEALRRGVPFRRRRVRNRVRAKRTLMHL